MNSGMNLTPNERKTSLHLIYIQNHSACNHDGYDDDDDDERDDSDDNNYDNDDEAGDGLRDE